MDNISFNKYMICSPKQTARNSKREYNINFPASFASSPWLCEVSEVHLSNEAPADASIIAVLQQHSFLPAVCLVALGPVSAHPQVELHKFCPLGVQVPAYQLPQPRLTTAHTKKL